MNRTIPFNSPYRHGFVRVAAAIPEVAVARPAWNADAIINLARQADERSVAVAVFPELALSGYSCEDLFGQESLLDACRTGLGRVVEASRELSPLLLVGVPLVVAGSLYNVAVAVSRGNVLAVIPKTFLPDYREFYEKRQFASGADLPCREVELLGKIVPIGTDLVLENPDIPGFAVAVEICEDLWVPVPPTTFSAMGGATVLCNLSASNVTIGKADYRRQLCASHSAKSVAAYIYAGAGSGESTTDLAWDGHGLIYENGARLAETERFPPHAALLVADIDVERLSIERRRLTTWQDCAVRFRDRVETLRRVAFSFPKPMEEISLVRTIERFPYVPFTGPELDERCAEAFRIQVAGLRQRFLATGTPHAVIGVSGGLDSTHALLVCARTFDLLEKPRSAIIGVTMPGFATSARTLDNARSLMKELGVTSLEIDIRPGCRLMLETLDHPFAHGQAVYDVTFENVQAGERSSHLFRLANQRNGLVIGTGDLSELALGWCTYGIGDHMSHYNVNASVPKTLIQHMVRWVVRTGGLGVETERVLESILATEISPELVPDDTETGQPGQRSEDKIGPYELQDFHLYYISRFGFRPSKVAWLAHQAWGDPQRGSWPAAVDGAGSRRYDLAAIKHWLGIFLERFFQFSQFKRSCVPNAPKVGTGGSLSPRGDWRAPSDISAALWLEELRENTP